MRATSFQPSRRTLVLAPFFLQFPDEVTARCCSGGARW